MAVTIGSNILSQKVLRQLGAATDSLSTTFERLSSGQRINKASDDAAGLAVASALNTDRRVFTQGVRNLNDGISYLSIADGAVSELTGIVIRQQELAEQAANGTYSSKQRDALDKEAQALSAEYFRIARTTQFNGIKIFDGGVQGLRLQAGYGTQGGISSSLGGKMGDGTFGSATNLNKGSGVFTFVYAADLNSDGTLDLIASNANDDTVSIFSGNGDGTFKAGTSQTTGDAPNGISAGDFSGDGILDLVVSTNLDSSISLLIGNGNGTFKAPITLPSGGNTGNGLYAADLNGDGFLDIVDATYLSNSLSILLGNGNGTFKANNTVAVGSGVVGVYIADLNSDGIADIVSGNDTGGTVSVLLGNGNGTFKAQISLAAGAGAQGVAATDFNGDGILDLVSANHTSNTLTVFIGNGNGTFKANISLVANDAYVVVTGDVNGDGLPDLLTANLSGNSSSIFLSNGDGTFKASTSFAVGTTPYGVLLADFNGDGVLDTFSGNTNDVSILLGNTRDGIGPQLPFSLKTQLDAKVAIPQLANNLSRLSQQRATIGAFESRISSAVTTLGTTRENYAAAESRIRDADIAEESANLTSRRILQQVGTAVLAQANQTPSLALTLLTAA